ncbi:hypothetical protein ACP70R_004108 [Stipagrostis hirtigluma subsp. patula]
MKRKASSAFEEEQAGEPQRLDDEFLAAEILPRLPAHDARGFAAASTFFRGLLTGQDYWSRAPRPCPSAACLVVRGGDGDGGGHEFHYADAGSSAEPAVVRAAGETATGPMADGYRYAGTCNGLVLLAAPWSNDGCARGVLFNPASGEEEAVVLALPLAGVFDTDVYHRRFCGLGYSASSKSYKAILCTRDFLPLCGGNRGELAVVPFSGAAAGRQKPRTLATVQMVSNTFHEYFYSLTLDGKVYLLHDMSRSPPLLAFDVDDETVTAIPFPPRIGVGYYELMEVWGRPCIAIGQQTLSELWVLTPELRWECRSTLAVGPSPSRRCTVHYDHFVIRGAWDCGGGLLYALFGDGRGRMYDLRETTPPPARVANPLPGEAAKALLPAELQEGTFCWGYRPTLVPPTTVFGGGPCSGERDGWRHSSSGQSRLRKSPGVTRRRCVEELMEAMTRKPTRRGEEVPCFLDDEERRLLQWATPCQIRE